MKTIVLAGGCFWGVEEYFSRIEGVLNTKVGYANGTFGVGTYENICSGKANHAEAVQIEYDETVISLNKLLRKFWNIIDPTVLNRQGNDIGVQYRTGIYYTDKNDLTVIKKSLEMEQKKYQVNIMTEIKKLENFFDGEEYHQNYLKKHPNGYCHIKLD